MNKNQATSLLYPLKSYLLPFAIVLIAFHSSFSQSGPVTFSGDKEKGIKWTIADSWEAVKAKALKENKYIFLDFYTTWCGPCKAMDKFVYGNDTIGNAFNDKFISVKVQVDITPNDDEQTKKWYADAANIFKLFKISAYPSFIFLSPHGEIVYKETGYKDVQQLSDLAQIATKSGTAYKNEYAEYDRLVADYKAGIKYYDRMPYMIGIALKFYEDDLARKLLNDHADHLMTLDPRLRYTKETIELWSSFLLKSSGSRFRFFYKEGKLIDSVMGAQGYADKIVDNTIYAEIVEPFLQKMNDTLMGKRLPVRLDGTIEPDYTEADWKGLKKMIRKKFNKESAKRNVLAVKVKWYKQRNNYPAYVACRLQQMKATPPEVVVKDLGGMNIFAWYAFLYVNDKSLLNQVLGWTEKTIEKHPRFPGLLDTHANLLYKLGKVSDAIQFEEMAVSTAFARKDTAEATGFQKVVKQMKNGERTYLGEGAIWK